MSGITYQSFPAQFMLFIPSRSSKKDPYSGFILMNAVNTPATDTVPPHIYLTPAPSTAVFYEFEKDPCHYSPGSPRWMKFRGDVSITASEHVVRTWTCLLRNTETGTQIPVLEILKVNRLFAKILKRNVLIRVAATNTSVITHVVAPPTPTSSSPTAPPTPTFAPTPIKKKPATAIKPTGLCLHVAHQLLELAQIKKEMCPIIAEEFTAGETAVMPCGHLFSKLAIEETFKKESNKCPACRQSGVPTFV